jgi:hypothetical protein
MRRWDREEAVGRVFGTGGHVDSARMVNDRAIERAHECRLVGHDGVLWNAYQVSVQLKAARRIIRDAAADDLIGDGEFNEMNIRISNAERSLREQLDGAIMRGCPCSKPPEKPGW